MKSSPPLGRSGVIPVLVLYARVRSHLAITNAKNLRFFVRYSEAFGRNFLAGRAICTVWEQGRKFSEGSFVIARFPL